MTSSRVTVIVPVYNRETMVERALDSVFAQTVSDVHLIVVDDGSTDGTPEILKRYADRALVITQPNAGAYPARNLALQHTKGEYIAFLDSDDFWMPERLERQLAILSAAPDTALVFGNGKVVSMSPRKLAPTFFDGAKPHRGHVFPHLIRNNFIPTSSVLVRSECFKKYGPFLELPLAADYHKWLQIARYEIVDFTPEIVFEYTHHDRGISRDRVRSYEMAVRVYEDLLRAEKDDAAADLLRAQQNRTAFWVGLAAISWGLGSFARGLTNGQFSTTTKLRHFVEVLTDAGRKVLARRESR